MRACVRARTLDRARDQLIVPDMSTLLLLCNQYQRVTDSVLLRQSSLRYCVALPRSVTLTVLYTHGLETVIVYTSRILVDTLVFFIC